jgi:hypothetical protein
MWLDTRQTGLVVIGSALPCGSFSSLRSLKLGERTGVPSSGLVTIAEVRQRRCVESA